MFGNTEVSPLLTVEEVQNVALINELHTTNVLPMFREMVRSAIEVQPKFIGEGAGSMRPCAWFEEFFRMLSLTAWLSHLMSMLALGGQRICLKVLTRIKESGVMFLVASFCFL